MYKVSVIVPIYNVEKYIERLAHSLFQQTLDEIEYIFVNDASPDDSISILKTVIEEYPHRKSHTKILSHEVNRGLTAARNTGLQEARGLYIAYCDADDFLNKDMYKKLYYVAEKKNSDVVLCDFFMHMSEHDNRYTSTIQIKNDKVATLKAYIAYEWTVVWNMIARKELYYKYSLRSPDGITFCEDFWLTVRLLQYAQNISKVNEALYYYNRSNTSSILHTLNLKSEQDERRACIETISFFRENGVFDLYERELSWRLIKSTHDSIYHQDRYHEFLEICPDTHKYILSCPFVNKKSKLFMWMLSHNMQRIALGILKIRYIIKNRKDVI